VVEHGRGRHGLLGARQLGEESPKLRECAEGRRLAIELIAAAENFVVKFDPRRCEKIDVDVVLMDVGCDEAVSKVLLTLP